MPNETAERALDDPARKATLSGITVYPLKSAGGIALREAELDELGLRHDRRWTVVDAQDRALTQRTHPQMARIRVALEDGTLALTAPGMPRLELPLAPAAGTEQEVVVWNDRVTARSTGDRAARWISDWLEEPCRIVYMPPTTLRPVEARYAVGAVGLDRLSFADAFPFLLLSEASLDALNRKLDEPLPMNRFRPNLVVRGVGAHDEDRWRRIRIGGTLFHVVKSCSRCAITTTDQETGERSKDQEPLRTLARYRRADSKVLFGRYLVHQATGCVRVGDGVEVLEAEQEAS